MKRMTRTLKQRFWEKVDKIEPDKCWNWKASRSGTGARYGQIKVNGKMCKSHRISYEMAYGSIPNGMYILHRCDNGLCVNPNHLFIGNQFDNMRDCISKGRGPDMRGETNGNSKLLYNDVASIRSRYNTETKKYGLISKMAREYDLTPTAIWQVVHNLNWNHI